jgi:hypothetical protein
MAKPDPGHIFLLNLADGAGLTEKKQTLLTQGHRMAAYFYDEVGCNLLQVAYDPNAKPKLMIIAKCLPLHSVMRHIYRRHGDWLVMENGLGLNTDKDGYLT